MPVTMAAVILVVLVALTLSVGIVALGLQTYCTWRIQFKHKDVFRSFRTVVPMWRPWTKGAAAIQDQMRFGVWWREKGYRNLGDPSLERVGMWLDNVTRVLIPLTIVMMAYGFVFSLFQRP